MSRGGSLRAERRRRPALALALALLLTHASPALALPIRDGDVPRIARPVAPPAPSPRLTWSTIGSSVRGRPIRLASFGAGPRAVLFVGGMHGDEYGAPVAEAFAAYLVQHPSAVPVGTRIDVIGCVNPDGRAAGTRGNARGVDLNRNLPSSDWRSRADGGCTAGTGAGSEPETKALVARLSRGYAAVVALHSTGPAVDYDGPGGYALALRVSAASGMRVTKLPTYSGSLGSYVPEVLRAPVITVELPSASLSRGVLAGLLAAAR